MLHLMKLIGVIMNLYNKYGGFEAYHKIIYGLYLELFSHPEIAHHFVGVDIDTLSKHQTQFLCRFLGGKVKYEGGSMKQVHQDMNISEFQFGEVAKAFRDVFIKHGFSDADADYIMRFVGRYQKVIVECKFSPIDRFMISIYHLWDKLIHPLRPQAS